MAAKSNNYLDVYDWIAEELIPSCTTEEHLDVVRKIINQFELLHPIIATFGLEYRIAIRRRKIEILSLCL